MRLSIVLLLCSLAGILGGAALISVPMIGVALIFDSLCVGVWALLRDDGQQQAPSVHEVPGSLHDVLERARRAA